MTADPSRAARESVAAQLHAQPWPRIIAQLTAYAFKRTRGRSMALAQDIAQQAIAHAFAHKGGWDPAKQPLMRYLATQVIGLSLNEWRRKRNAYEVALDDEADEILESPDDAPDDALDQRRRATAFHDRLVERLAGDDVATMLVTLMLEGLAAPRDLAEATGRPIAEVRDARRRIRYQAEQVTKELSLGLEEVTL